MYENDAFWVLLDQLIESSEIVIDRLKNTSHPRYPEFIYPVDITKRDSEMKILYNCSEDEVQKIYALHNETHAMKGILIRRDE